MTTPAFPEHNDYNLPWTPTTLLNLTKQIQGVDLDIKLFTKASFQTCVNNPNYFEWALFINDVIESSSSDSNMYDRAMTTPFDFGEKGRTLIVGGGDFSISNLIQEEIEFKSFEGEIDYSVKTSNNITIVDPLANELYPLMNAVRPVRNELMHYSAFTFGEWFEKIKGQLEYHSSQHKYKNIIVDVSDDNLEVTSEIYSPEFFKKLNRLVSKQGSRISMYFPGGSEEQIQSIIKAADVPFEIIGSTSWSEKSWNSNECFVVYMEVTK